MAVKHKGKINETDLYQPVKDYLTQQGYSVYSEVKNCDVTAVKGDELVVVELKLSVNLTLLVQAAQRQCVADLVYVAVPYPRQSLYSPAWRGITHLLRRLELGLILVKLNGREPAIEVVFHPVPFSRVRSFQRAKKKRSGIIKEICSRSDDYNTGGSSKQKLLTAYRENAIQIACCLKKFGPLSPKQLKQLGAVDKTQSILSKNFYGWFERVQKGVYSLSSKGISELETFSDVVQLHEKLLCESESIKNSIKS